MDLNNAPWHQSLPQAQAPQATAAGLVPTMSLPEYRQRLVEIYSVYKPDNVLKVDYLLEKYRGNEDFLYRSVCTKYDVDPSRWSAQVAAALPPPPPPPPSYQGVWMGSVPAATIKARPPMGPMPGRPFLPAPTRAGIGYQASAPPLKLDPAPAPPLKLEPPVVPKQRHEVMEWDPATGKMVATSIEIDAPEAAPEVKAAPSEPVVVQAPIAQPVQASENDAHPFTPGVEPVRRELNIIEIDTLLLGEPSGFFEALKLGPGAEADPVVAISRESTSATMPVDAGPAEESTGPPAEPVHVSALSRLLGSDSMEVDGGPLEAVATGAPTEPDAVQQATAGPVEAGSPAVDSGAPADVSSSQSMVVDAGPPGAVAAGAAAPDVRPACLAHQPPVDESISPPGPVAGVSAGETKPVDAGPAEDTPGAPAEPDVAAMIRVIGVAMDTGEMSQGAPEEASGPASFDPYLAAGEAAGSPETQKPDEDMKADGPPTTNAEP